MNGIKHGWLEGFEAGQIQGVKQVFFQAYLNDINLFEKLVKNGQRNDLSILDQLDIDQLKREKMNTFYKTFYNLHKPSNKQLLFRSYIEKFRKLSTN